MKSNAPMRVARNATWIAAGALLMVKIYTFVFAAGRAPYRDESVGYDLVLIALRDPLLNWTIIGLLCAGIVLQWLSRVRKR